MKIVTGTIKDGAIILDSPPPLPDRTRVKIILQAASPADPAVVDAPAEDIELVRRSRPRLGRITRRECR